MWKLLRNLLFSALVMGVGLKLALWTAAHQQAKQLTERVAPWGSLTWSSANGSFDGSIRLSGVRFLPKAGIELGSINASEMRLRSPGLLWTLRRAITRDTRVPDQLGITLINTSWPALGALGGNAERPWFGPLSLVPFETQGCGVVTRLAQTDYQGMGLAPQLPRFDLDYQLNTDEHTLRIDLAIANQPFVDLGLQLDLTDFSPRVTDTPAAREALRIGSATLDYRDHGYLARRNQFCAQQLGVDVDKFIDQHVAAVQETLKTQHLVPAEAVVELYRNLLDNGGELKLLSLPRSDIAPAQYSTYDPEEVLRWLNLTARHNDAPPVLFKLFFLAEPVEALAGIDAALVHDPLAEPDTETVVVRPAVPTTNPVLDTTSAVPVAPQVPIAAAKPEPPLANPGKPAAPTAARPTAPLASASVPPATGSGSATVNAPAKPANSPLAVTQPLPRVPAPASGTNARTATSRLDPRISGVPSAPPPPPGSTAALVWRGAGIDRLPTGTSEPRERSYIVIAYDGLSSQIGARVAVITSGGKEIEGKVAAVDASGVTLNLNRETGQAQFFVERQRILEIRVQRAARG